MAGKGCAILALRLFRRLWRFKAVEALSGKGFRGGSAFGRLRVETLKFKGKPVETQQSRLWAAAC